MDIHEIEAALENPDFQYRLKAISSLKDYSSDLAVPILIRTAKDPEFLVRTFVARGLGQQQTAASFATLLELMKLDNTPSVRAEAANSLSLFGRVAASHLVKAFIQDDHWLVRRSILSALIELECPHELYEVCLHSLEGEDFTVREAAVDALGMLANSNQRVGALASLLTLCRSDSARMRRQVAYALKQFDEPEAKEALVQLQHDPDYQVVGAALENLFQA